MKNLLEDKERENSGRGGKKSQSVSPSGGGSSYYSHSPRLVYQDSGQRTQPNS